MTNKINILNTQINKFNLKFIDPEKEKQFHLYYAKRYLFQLRLAHVLAVFFYVIAAFGDFLLVEFNPGHIIGRILIAVPAFLVGYALTFVRKGFYLKYYQYFNALYVLLTGISFVYIAAAASSPENYFIYNGLIVSLIFNYTFIKQDVVKASVIGTVLVLVYIVALSMDDIYFNYAFHGVLYITITNFLGMFIAYTVELDGRKTFIYQQNLEMEKARVNEINAELETLVENRTAALKSELEERKTIEEELIEYRENLEAIVEKRTAEIKKQKDELEYLNSLFVNREFRIKELRDELKRLKE